MKISVAMTTYNGAKYIIPQLDSLLAQTRVIDQLVICDDCSQDKTVDIIREYFQQTDFTGLKLVVNDKNLGYIKNFYQAISLCEGDLIFLCDQDDIWCPEKIEIMTKLFEEHPEMYSINTSFDRIDANGSYLSTSKKYQQTNNNLLWKKLRTGEILKIDFKDMILRNISPGCTMAFKQSCKHFFLNNFSSLSPHDWEINLFASLHNGAYFYNKILTHYRIHDNNTIGLKEINVNNFLSMKKDQSFREKEAGLQNEKLTFYKKSAWFVELSKKNQRLVKKCSRVVAKRADALKEKSIWMWIRTCFHFIDYAETIGFRAIFGDLIYIIKEKHNRNI
ncbi:MAG: glycosyltransferase family 2 protein [Anaerofustis sp.]